MIYTYAELEVTAATFEEIELKLLEVDYGHTFHKGVIDMKGIGLKKEILEGPDGVYPAPMHGWTCFHCGRTFLKEVLARKHFGEMPDSVVECLVKP